MISPDEMRAQLAAASAPNEEKPFTELPPLAPITINMLGTRNKRYAHTFMFKVPNVGEQIEIGRLKSAYLPAGGGADPNAALLVEQVCYLEVTLQKDHLPAWWKPFDMFDASPVSAVYLEAIKYERRFHGAGASDSAGSSEVAARAENGTATHAEGAAVVDGEIPPSAKRRTVLLAHAEGGD